MFEEGKQILGQALGGYAGDGTSGTGILKNKEVLNNRVIGANTCLLRRLWYLWTPLSTELN